MPHTHTHTHTQRTRAHAHTIIHSFIVMQRAENINEYQAFVHVSHIPRPHVPNKQAPRQVHTHLKLDSPRNGCVFLREKTLFGWMLCRTKRATPIEGSGITSTLMRFEPRMQKTCSSPNRELSFKKKVCSSCSPFL